MNILLLSLVFAFNPVVEPEPPPKEEYRWTPRVDRTIHSFGEVTVCATDVWCESERYFVDDEDNYDFLDYTLHLHTIEVRATAKNGMHFWVYKGSVFEEYRYFPCCDITTTYFWYKDKRGGIASSMQEAIKEMLEIKE
jgi:hypothetical protein